MLMTIHTEDPTPCLAESISIINLRFALRFTKMLPRIRLMGIIVITTTIGDNMKKVPNIINEYHQSPLIDNTMTATAAINMEINVRNV